MPRAKRYEEMENYLMTDEGLDHVLELSKKGLTLNEIATQLGMTRNTLYIWSKKNPRLQASLDEGRKVADDRVVESLYESCFTRTEKTITVEKDEKGNVVRTTVKTQVIPANVTAIQYWLSNRQGATWKARQQLELSAESALPLVIRDDLDTTKEQS